MPKDTHKAFASIGQEIVREQWGRTNELTIAEMIKKSDQDVLHTSLLAAILKELQETRKAIEAAARQISRAVETAPTKAEIALEKARQKTADKQRKANEASPPIVTVIQCPNDVIDKIPIRRLRGKW